MYRLYQSYMCTQYIYMHTYVHVCTHIDVHIYSHIYILTYLFINYISYSQILERRKT